MQISKSGQNRIRQAQTEAVEIRKEKPPVPDGKTETPANTEVATRQEAADRKGVHTATGAYTKTQLGLRLSDLGKTQEPVRTASDQYAGADLVAEKLGEKMDIGQKGIPELGEKGSGDKMGRLAQQGGQVGFGSLRAGKGDPFAGTWDPKSGSSASNPAKSADDIQHSGARIDPRIASDYGFRSGGTQTSTSSSSDYMNSRGDQVVETTTTTIDHETGNVMVDTMKQTGNTFEQSVTITGPNGEVLASESSTSEGTESTGDTKEGEKTAGTSAEESQQKPEADPKKKTTQSTPMPDEGGTYRQPELSERELLSAFGIIRDTLSQPDGEDSDDQDIAEFQAARENVLDRQLADDREINWGPEGGGTESGIPVPDSHGQPLTGQVETLRGGDPLDPLLGGSSPGLGPDGRDGEIPSDPDR